MRRPEFAGRPGNFSGTFFQKGKTGITTTEGKHWSQQRGFLVNHLEGLTNSKGFEEVILDEFSDLKVDLSRKKTPVAVSYKLNVAIMNILWNLCSGRKLHSQQQEFQTVYECIDKVRHCFNATESSFYRSGHSVHVSSCNLQLHANPNQDFTGVDHKYRARKVMVQARYGVTFS